MVKFLKENAIFVISSILLGWLVVSSAGSKSLADQGNTNMTPLTNITDSSNGVQATSNPIPSPIETGTATVIAPSLVPTPLPVLNTGTHRYSDNEEGDD